MGLQPGESLDDRAMEHVIRPPGQRLQEVGHHLTIVVAIGAPHQTMDVVPIGWPLRPRFLDQTVQCRFADRWEHHLTDRAIRLGDRCFGQCIQESGFAVDVLHILEQFFDDFLLGAHGNPMHHLQQ